MNYPQLDATLAILSLLASVLNLSVRRSPSVPESRALDAMRNVRAAAWLCLSARVGWVLHQVGDWPAPIYTLAPLVALATADCVSCLVRLATANSEKSHEAASATPATRRHGHHRQP